MVGVHRTLSAEAWTMLVPPLRLTCRVLGAGAEWLLLGSPTAKRKAWIKFFQIGVAGPMLNLRHKL